jgi:hypothetical protein
LIINPHTKEPGHSHRREHVSYVSPQVNTIIVALVVGKIDDETLSFSDRDIRGQTGAV